MLLRLRLFCLFGGCWFYWAQPAFASNTDSFAFAQQAQPLGNALVSLARTINQTLIYDPEQVKAIQAPPLKGSYTAVEALAALLNASDLQASELNNGWLIKRIPKATATAVVHAAAPSSEPAPIEELTVTASYGDSLDRASLEKQFAAQSKELIFASDIAEFPAFNIAEALNRTPGISVERDRGEALFISVRGLPTQFNTLTVNGLHMAANENVRTSEQYGRRFHYDLLPAELVAAVDVSKSPMASDPAGTIGGNVNIRTYHPLELGDDRFAFTFAASESPLAEHTDPRTSLLGNWVNASKTLGFTLAGAWSQRHIRQDRALAFDWITDNSQEDNPRHYIASLRPTQEQESRQRWGLSSTLQWQPSAAQTLSLQYLRLARQIDYQEYSYSADFTLDNLDTATSIWNDNILTSATTYDGSAQISRESAGLLDVSQTLQLSYQAQLAGWQVELNATGSEADSRNNDPIRRTRLRRDDGIGFNLTVDKNLSRNLPSLTYFTLDLTDASEFPGRRLEWRVNQARDTQTSIALNLHHELASWFDSVDAGLMLQRHRRNYQRRDQLITDGINGQYFAQSDFTLVNNGFLSNQGADMSLPRQWLVPIESVFWQDGLIADADTPSDQDKLNSYRITEDTDSSFVQFNLDQAKMWGNLGVRLVNTRLLSQGYFTEAADIISASDIAFDSNHHYLLPAANLAYALTPNWQLRGAASKALSRPDLPDLAPRLTLNSGDELSAEGGNPYLRPIQAWQFDLSLTYYQQDNDYMGLSLFYKRLDSFIQDAISSLVVNGKTYQLQSKANGGRARVAGLEWVAQQSGNPFNLPGHQLGINLNLTLTESSAIYQQDNQQWQSDLAGVANRTFNTEVFYDTPGWSARINYNWTGAILQEIANSTQPARYSAAFGNLGLHLAYHLNDQVRLFIEGTNLLAQAEREYVLGGYFTNYSYYGRTLALGIALRL